MKSELFRSSIKIAKIMDYFASKFSLPSTDDVRLQIEIDPRKGERFRQSALFREHRVYLNENGRQDTFLYSWLFQRNADIFERLATCIPPPRLHHADLITQVELLYDAQVRNQRTDAIKKTIVLNGIRDLLLSREVKERFTKALQARYWCFQEIVVAYMAWLEDNIEVQLRALPRSDLRVEPEVSWLAVQTMQMCRRNISMMFENLDGLKLSIENCLSDPKKPPTFVINIGY